MPKPQIIFAVPNDALKAELERQERTVRKLVQSGALDVRGGSVTLHFDADGELRKVDRNDTIYRT